MTRAAHLRPPSLAPVKISYEEFLRRDGEDNHVEWVDGEIVMMAPISDEHDDVAGFLDPRRSGLSSSFTNSAL